MALNVVPNPGQSLNNSRPLVNNNFATIDAGFTINHGSYGNANVGKHLFMQMPEQTVVPVTAANEGALYTKQGLSTVTELFFRRESNGAEISLTENLGTLAAPGWIKLPGGLTLYWNKLFIFGADPTLDYSPGIPAGWLGFAATPLAAFVTPYGPSGGSCRAWLNSDTLMTATHAHITATGGTIDAFVFLIGVGL